MDFQSRSTKTLSRQQPAVHANGNAVLLEQLGKFLARELAALVRIEDVRLAIAVDCFLHCLDTEVGGQRIG